MINYLQAGIRSTRRKTVAKAPAKRRVLPTSLRYTDSWIRGVTSATEAVAYRNRATKNADVTILWVSYGEEGVDWYFTWICLFIVSTSRKKTP